MLNKYLGRLERLISEYREAKPELLPTIEAPEPPVLAPMEPDDLAAVPPPVESEPERGREPVVKG